MVSQYCQLLAKLLSHQSTSSNQRAGPDIDEDLANEWEELEEAEFDPLDSPKDLFSCCLSVIVSDTNFALYFLREKFVYNAISYTYLV